MIKKADLKTFIYSGIVGAAISVSVYWILRGPPPLYLAFFNEGKTYEIEMNEDGFSPENLTVKSGDVVRFVNQDAKPRWPASDFHPTHEIYPEFDPQKEVAPGGDWTFRFDRSGSWKFHDHLNPHLRGKIIVTGRTETSARPPYLSSFGGLRKKGENEEMKEYLRSQMQICEKEKPQSQEKRNCYRQLGTLLMEQLPFEEISKTFSEVGLDCHLAMHYVVNAAYKNGAGLSDIWPNCTTACFGACYHGGLEGFLQKQNVDEKDDSAIRETTKSLCQNIPSSLAHLTPQCYHGLGHAFMLFTAGDLPRSLKLCDLMGKDQNSCYGGIFMENSFKSATGEHVPRYLKRDDPLYPCNAIEKQYQRDCYAFKTVELEAISKRQWEKVPGACGKIPEEFQDACYKQMGMAAHISTSDYQKLKNICLDIPKENMRKECIRGLLMFYSDRFPGNPAKAKDMINICIALDPEEYKNFCYEHLNSVWNSFDPDRSEQKSLCEKAESPYYRNICLGKI